ncbi:MAG: glycosyltransferase [Candidatus Omnitrophica bacterium]|nr:glycosyltransferase [Candidatus Omnitrophota bacterium]
MFTGELKVAFFVYPSAFQNKGGGEILLENLEKYLKLAGVDVRRFDTWNDKIEDYSILHVFGAVKECLPLMRVGRSRGVKVVLESIFWSDYRRAFCEEGTFIKKAEEVIRHTLKVLCPVFPSGRKKMFDTADVIIPNSEGEAAQISRLFGIPRDKMRVVANGVDKVFFAAEPEIFIKSYGISDFILSVGRIEPRKNQLNLIRAVKGSGRELVLIGEAVSGYEWYMEACRKEAGENVRFLGRLDHGSGMLRSAYAACGVFVLPAWFETPGLAALEAGLAGAKLAVTDGGSTREYFKDMALYLRPDSPDDIRDKIETAFRSPKTDLLRQYIMSDLTWEKIALKTAHVYKTLAVA